MPILIALGAVLVIAGLAGLGYCIWVGLAVRRSVNRDPAAARARLSHLVAVNLASLCTAALGLALVVVGLFL